MSDEKDTKWLPYNEDGSPHDCRPNPETNTENGIEKPTAKEFTVNYVELKYCRFKD